jgi:hypothetical protein
MLTMSLCPTVGAWNLMFILQWLAVTSVKNSTCGFCTHTEWKPNKSVSWSMLCTTLAQKTRLFWLSCNMPWKVDLTKCRQLSQRLRYDKAPKLHLKSNLHKNKRLWSLSGDLHLMSYTKTFECRQDHYGWEALARIWRNTLLTKKQSSLVVQKVSQSTLVNWKQSVNIGQSKTINQTS